LTNLNYIFGTGNRALEKNSSFIFLSDGRSGWEKINVLFERWLFSSNFNVSTIFFALQVTCLCMKSCDFVREEFPTEIQKRAKMQPTLI
jgi:hypothetical protein